MPVTCPTIERRPPGAHHSRKETNLLITGVNPFEDLPGYHYASLLRDSCRHLIRLADDSAVALRVLQGGGANVVQVSHPGVDETAFAVEIDSIVRTEGAVAVVPGTDAHLFALARLVGDFAWIRELCPSAAWLSDNEVWSKWDLQGWIESYLPVPERWIADAQTLTTWFSVYDAPKVVVKGLRKGAVPCEYLDELGAAARFLMRNPANQDAAGGLYLERHIEGEEHSVLIVRLLDRTVYVGIRKLAATQSGTTVAALVEYDQLPPDLIESVSDTLLPGMAMEIEMRGTGEARRAFEVNIRFPSWVGALGEFGQSLLNAAVEAQLGHSYPVFPQPEAGTLIYRLPQGGALTPDAALSMKSPTAPILWPSASPHQFLVK